jgi:hypothetical protein
MALKRRPRSACNRRPRSLKCALVLGLPWQRIGEAGVITVL